MKFHAFLLFSVMGAALLGCTPGARQQTLPQQELAFPFPVDRLAASITNETQWGSSASQTSIGATVAGTALILPNKPSGFEWAVYEFTPKEPFTLEGVEVVFDLGQTEGAWVGVADFSALRWDFSGPYTDVANIEADEVAHLSDNGNVHVVVVAPASAARIESVALSVERTGWINADPNPATYPTTVPSMQPSMAVVNGKPAIVYRSADDTISYIRALDSEGRTWGNPIQPFPVGTMRFTPDLAVVNGYPVLCGESTDSLAGEMLYVSAADPEGNSWNSPVLVLTNGEQIGDLTVGAANGKPAVAFVDFSGTLPDIKFVQAMDAAGATWNPAVVVVADFYQYGSEVDFATVEGHPAIVHDGYVGYVRANDPDGLTWSPPISLDPTKGGDNVHLMVVHGHPTACWVNFGPPEEGIGLDYVRALDATGTTWPTRQKVVWGGVDHAMGITVVNGVPTMAYVKDFSHDLMYIEALDPDGNTWNTGEELPNHPNIIGPLYPFMTIASKPALAYEGYEAATDSAVLRFIMRY